MKCNIKHLCPRENLICEMTDVLCIKMCLSSSHMLVKNFLLSYWKRLKAVTGTIIKKRCITIHLCLKRGLLIFDLLNTRAHPQTSEAAQKCTDVLILWTKAEGTEHIRMCHTWQQTGIRKNELSYIISGVSGVWMISANHKNCHMASGKSQVLIYCSPDMLPRLNDVSF